MPINVRTDEGYGVSMMVKLSGVTYGHAAVTNEARYVVVSTSVSDFVPLYDSDADSLSDTDKVYEIESEAVVSKVSLGVMVLLSDPEGDKVAVKDKEVDGDSDGVGVSVIVSDSDISSVMDSDIDAVIVSDALKLSDNESESLMTMVSE
jgi:hypothetical protein